MFKVNRTKKYSRLALQQGFTLIELMIVLVILSVLLFVAVPGFDSVINDSRLDKARHSIATGIALARVEAVQRGAEVNFCKGSSGSCAAAAIADTSWSNDGWKVADSGGIIRVDDAANTGVAIDYECGETLTYNPLGGLSSNVSGDECEFEFSDEKNVAASSYLCIAATGRVRMSDNVCE